MSSLYPAPSSFPDLSSPCHHPQGLFVIVNAPCLVAATWSLAQPSILSMVPGCSTSPHRYILLLLACGLPYYVALTMDQLKSVKSASMCASSAKYDYKPKIKYSYVYMVVLHWSYTAALWLSSWASQGEVQLGNVYSTCQVNGLVLRRPGLKRTYETSATWEGQCQNADEEVWLGGSDE